MYGIAIRRVSIAIRHQHQEGQLSQYHHGVTGNVGWDTNRRGDRPIGAIDISGGVLALTKAGKKRSLSGGDECAKVLYMLILVVNGV